MEESIDFLNYYRVCGKATYAGFLLKRFRFAASSRGTSESMPIWSIEAARWHGHVRGPHGYTCWWARIKWNRAASHCRWLLVLGHDKCCGLWVGIIPFWRKLHVFRCDKVAVISPMVFNIDTKIIQFLVHCRNKVLNDICSVSLAYMFWQYTLMCATFSLKQVSISICDSDP